MLFAAKPPISKEEFDWLLACFAWLRTMLGDRHTTPQLIAPSHPDLLAARTGPELFEAVRGLMRMRDWPCRLEIVPDGNQHEPDGTISEGSGACGTCSVVDGVATIRYSSQMLANPDALAATFAHELCHFLLWEAGDPPGGPDLMEHSTDCAAAYLGFGVLLANSARTFAKWQDDVYGYWQSSTAGYLSEQSLVTATAASAALHGFDLGPAEDGLKPYLRSDLKKARKALAKRHPDLGTSLSGIDLLEWNYA
ncbi:hypothetical protein [Qipengyuania vesicularis]|uniref:hypothetical protein n=1 Tax=Qipengyuania vesicularis TaxID=2867232 RepID=UPI001C8752A6|nr:hypothetical protein [Qipengyuania vesicularis]MBX7527469.1 hypothetical protein [Qipengyuania vesicularis]